MSKITLQIDREIYKKLQQIKMTVEHKTIEDTIAEMVEIYGEQYKQKKLIQKMSKKII